jgi:hypothetical protein
MTMNNLFLLSGKLNRRYIIVPKPSEKKGGAKKVFMKKQLAPKLRAD